MVLARSQSLRTRADGMHVQPTSVSVTLTRRFFVPTLLVESFEDCVTSHVRGLRRLRIGAALDGHEMRMAKAIHGQGWTAELELRWTGAPALLRRAQRRGEQLSCAGKPLTEKRPRAKRPAGYSRST